MEISKPNKLQKPKDISNLLSEVASFASSIGLSSSLPSSGFNDSDFRITGPLKPHKPSTVNRENGKNKPNNNNNNHKNENKSKSRVLPRSKKTKPNNSRVSPSQTKPLPKLPLMKAASLAVWYSDAAELEGKVIGDNKLEVVNVKEWEDVVREKREVGERLLAQYAQDYELSSRRQRGDMKMLYAVQKSGTTQDKTSAYSILVAENPIANLKSLDSLLDMVASKGGKRYAFMGFDTLKELFIYCLLPDRKLKELEQRPLNNLPESKDGYSLLLFWYWEDCLKSRYKSFIFALEEASRDVLHSLKDKALKIMYALLTNKSEEGRRLLSALVNKLGDPGNKTASTANFHLLKLLPIHPNMKGSYGIVAVHFGEQIGTKTERIGTKMQDSTMCEGIAAEMAILMALDNQWSNVIFYGDCCNIIKFLKDCNSDVLMDWGITPFIHNCRILCNEISICEFVQIPREQNHIAHNHAKEQQMLCNCIFDTRLVQ